MKYEDKRSILSNWIHNGELYLVALPKFGVPNNTCDWLCQYGEQLVIEITRNLVAQNEGYEIVKYDVVCDTITTPEHPTPDYDWVYGMGEMDFLRSRPEVETAIDIAARVVPDGATSGRREINKDKLHTMIAKINNEDIRRVLTELTHAV